MKGCTHEKVISIKFVCDMISSLCATEILLINAHSLYPIADSVKAVLGRHTKILVKYMIKLETKSDKTENRVLVFTPVRVYLLTAKVPTRIDCS